MSACLIIRADAILDGAGGHRRIPTEVVTQGDRVVAVAPAGSWQVGPDDTVLDFPGATLMPGLIDCHVHLTGLHCPPYDVPDVDHDSAVAVDTIALARGLEQLLAVGITTVRDCGYPHHGLFGVRAAHRAGLFRGSRLVVSGRALTTTGGHAPNLSVKADGVDAVRQAAREEIAVGADWIKLMLTGGTGSPHERVEDVQMSLEEARAAAAEAHGRGRRIAAHCSNLAGAHMALDAGVDSIEHGIDLDDAAVDRMVESGVWLSAGLRCTRVEAEAGDDSGIPPFVRAKAAEIVDRQEASFQRALRRGVNIAAATDAGPDYVPIGIESLISELETMQKLGMSTLDALSAATGRAGLLLGREDLGVLRPGAIADVLVVARDPAHSLAALRHPLFVVAAGEPHAGPPSG